MIPEWANFASNKEYDFFIESVKNYFEKKNYSITFADSVILIDGLEEFGVTQFGLINISQICANSDMLEWGNIICKHFDTAASSHKFDEIFFRDVEDFDKVKQFIGVRIYNKNYIQNIESVLYSQITEDMIAMIVFDLPESIMNVQPASLTDWGKNFDEVFNLGVSNIHKKYPNTLSEEVVRGIRVTIIEGEHIFSTNAILNLEAYLELDVENGCLIAAPLRDRVLVFPLDDLDASKIEQVIIPIVYGMNRDGPGSVSNKLYWYIDGAFANLPYKITEGKIDFLPPKEFTSMLDNLNQ